MKKIFLVGFVVILTCGFTGCFTLGDSGQSSVTSKAVEVVYREISYSELSTAIQNVNSPGNGFIVEAYFRNTDAPGEGSYRISDARDGTPSQWFDAHDGGYDDTHYFNYMTPLQFEIYNDQTYRRIDKTKKYKIFLGVYQNTYGGYWVPFIDRIEGLWTMEEVAAINAKQKAESEAKRKAEQEAEAIAREAKFNPNNFDRSQYREIKVEDFSFDMVAGKLVAGTKIAFEAKFLTKPTGTNYSFENVDTLITLSTIHNFVRDIPDRCFGPYQDLFLSWQSKDFVKIFVTVKKAGQSGECSVDIVEW